MWRRKKLIIVAVLAAVMLVGSIGGVILAADNGDDSQPEARCGALWDRICEIYNANPDRPGDIDCETLKAAFAEARSEMQGEQLDGRRFRVQMANRAGILGNLGIEIDWDALKAALADARERIQAGEDRQEVMAEVLASFGIDIEDLKAGWADDGERPFKHGFRGMGGPRGWGGRCIPTE